jgi:Tol biopolymer transport system component
MRTLLSLLVLTIFSARVLGSDSGCLEDQNATVSQRQTNKNQVTKITFDGRLKHDPVFVDDGKSIVYTSLEKFNQLCLMKVPFSPGHKPKPVRFHGAANTSELMASFSKNPDIYAFLRNNGNLHFEIVLENKITGKSTSYNPGGGFAGIRNISYAPDGQNVIFAFPNQNGPQQIQALSKDGKSNLLLTNSEGVNGCPKYSPDGKQIVFSSSRDGDFDIFVMNSDGSMPVNISKSKGLETHPCFSPDGKQIAFTAIRNGHYNIYLMNADGSNVRKLTKHPEVDDYPCWSPDGKTIVWVGEREGQKDLYSIEIN